MKVFTTEKPAGVVIKSSLGVVYGNTIRSRHVGKDVLAVFRILIGGEIHEYTKLMAEAREQSIDRMKEKASKLGANGIVGLRFASSVVASGAAELLAYGTAVILE